MERKENEDLKKRTKEFIKQVIIAYQKLPKSDAIRDIGRQFLRSGSSVGANTRSAFRGRSRKEFIAKLGIVIEEADECLFWMEVMSETPLVQQDFSYR